MPLKGRLQSKIYDFSIYAHLCAIYTMFKIMNTLKIMNITMFKIINKAISTGLTGKMHRKFPCIVHRNMLSCIMKIEGRDYGFQIQR